jgi:hypothetical protein
VEDGARDRAQNSEPVIRTTANAIYAGFLYRKERFISDGQNHNMFTEYIDHYPKNPFLVYSAYL